MDKSYLLDTYALLCFLNGDEHLSSKARKAIADPQNRCFNSIASLWEIAVKIKIGKLGLQFDLQELSTHLAKNNIELLPIAFEHILETMDLEDQHRDPFDWIIIAQAKYEKLVIISKDGNFHKYQSIKLLW
ncbi:type II toxin-antitoxin system VapC family toxin [Cesiribacter andamanensis]|uniref:PIN domain protein n=1 Tax=Cesiribacter andamanensis AMV16 TaxID=1279009 RepID=M7N3N1_9BACT|nr:type II toxin-antitoxin system VapC family toxin [Cesiribacter andamanensis]EMR03263.1 PIN domain protein [Cesiribacter andamanensis AMV16]